MADQSSRCLNLAPDILEVLERAMNRPKRHLEWRHTRTLQNYFLSTSQRYTQGIRSLDVVWDKLLQPELLDTTQRDQQANTSFPIPSRSQSKTLAKGSRLQVTVSRPNTNVFKRASKTFHQNCGHLVRNSFTSLQKWKAAPSIQHPGTPLGFW